MELKILLIFAVVYLAMIANSFWESMVEGRNSGYRHKLGWKIPLGKHYKLTEYHFYLFFVMWPALLSLPLIVNGWDTRLFGILLSAYTSGLVIEDFTWFLVNPAVKFSNWNPHFANYYPWIRAGKIKIPLLYIVGIFISMASWHFLWK